MKKRMFSRQRSGGGKKAEPLLPAEAGICNPTPIKKGRMERSKEPGRTGSKKLGPYNGSGIPPKFHGI